jgi:uncharacterized protein YjiS (DUF1127 family)
MSVIISAANSTEAPFVRTIVAVAAGAWRRLKHVVDAYANRSDAAVLVGFDERMLADIGLTRSDLRDAFAEPLWHDPTNVLRARALERRLSRHGVGPGFPESSVFSPPLAPEEGSNRPRTDRPARFTV